jgi:tripartite-type tricarboxylate transporter receptor subunit TctC
MGLFAPTGTPADAIGVVHRDIARVLRQPDMTQHFSDRGAEILAGGPDQLAAYVRRDYARYGQVIRQIGLRAD